MIRPGLALCLALMCCGSLVAQAPQSVPAGQAPQGGSVAETLSAVRSAENSTLTFFNRPIVVLRAQVLGRRPIERAVGAERMLDDLVAQGITGPVGSRVFNGGALLDVGTRSVLVLTSPDIDELSGETLEGVAAQDAARLRQALSEAAEAREPGILLRATGLASVAVVLAMLALWGLARAHRIVARKFVDIVEQRATKVGIAALDTLRASRVFDFQRHLVAAAIMTMDLVVIYSAVTFALRRFPYTRPWGESMRGFLLTTIEDLGLGVVRALPRLFTVVLIFAIARFVARLVKLWFDEIERGRVTVRGIYADTAQSTRRLAIALLWLFAIVVAYPYMPGSQTDAFKGVSVFLGVSIWDG